MDRESSFNNVVSIQLRDEPTNYSGFTARLEQFRLLAHGGAVTTTVMERADDGVNPTAGPIVLALSCAQVQQYLKTGNIPLQRWINPPLVRVDIQHLEAGINAYFVLPSDERSLVTIARHHKHMTWVELEEKVKDSSWLINRLIAVILANMQVTLKAEVDPDRIEIVFIADHLVRDGVNLRPALVQTFKNAWFFSAQNNRGSLPERIWTEPQNSDAIDAPFCSNCKTPMRVAGSTFVCEGCGSTKTPNWPDCVRCNTPMRILGAGELGCVYRCDKCGSTQEI